MMRATEAIASLSTVFIRDMTSIVASVTTVWLLAKVTTMGIFNPLEKVVKESVPYLNQVVNLEIHTSYAGVGIVILAFLLLFFSLKFMFERYW